MGNHRRRVYDKSIVKKEIIKVPEIKTFTPLHQMTNYIPIPQAHNMMSHPNIPVQQPLLQNNPLVNPLRDISGRNRTIQDVFNDRLQLREAKKKQQEEISKMLQEHKEHQRRNSGVSIGNIQNMSIPHNQTSIEQWMPILRDNSKPTPKNILKK